MVHTIITMRTTEKNYFFFTINNNNNNNIHDTDQRRPASPTSVLAADDIGSWW